MTATYQPNPSMSPTSYTLVSIDSVPSDGIFVVPAMYLGLPVLTIGNGSNIDAGITSPYSIIFENGSMVQTISEYAFEESANLTSISFPPSLMTIQGEAFYDCSMTISLYFSTSS